MSRHHETNPHFLPRQHDPILDFPSQTPPPRSRRSPRRHGRTPIESPHGRMSVEPPPNHGRPSPPHHYGRAPVEPPPHGRTSVTPPLDHGRSSPPPPRHYGRAPVEPPPHGRTSVTPPPQPPTHYPPTHVKPVPPFQHEVPHQHHQESRPPFVTEPDSHAHPERGQHGGGHHHRDRGFIHTPSRRTKPVAWLVAAFCALFWIIVIVGGLIILIVYLVFRPRSPRFDISTATINAAYLDMGYLLNADLRVLANFTNPNTKVNVEFSYVILDLYYGGNFVATRYIRPFAVMKGESRFADVHMVASQVRLSTDHSLQLQKQMEEGRVHIEIKGLFRAKSKLGGIFHYSYWMYAHCQLVVTGPPTGVLIGKKCVTKR
ncbi:proline-rich receptor-like kinase [Perilla frutescens var. frutescens]|nr:proline-rich receptor-like kinase [Perilla frutescens var. frutescens]